MLIAEKPRWMQIGSLDWKSYPEGVSAIHNAAHTVIRVKTDHGTYQHILSFEWADYGDQKDAEQFATWLVFHLSGQRVMQRESA